MNTTAPELTTEIDRLERAISIFEQRIAHARWLVAMLDRAKASHPRFLDWEWEHRNIPTETAARRLAHVLGELNTRILGAWKPDPDSNKPVHGIPSELLYSTQRPTVPDVLVIIKTAAGLPSNAKTIELLHVLCAKGAYTAVTDFVLGAADA